MSVEGILLATVIVGGTGLLLGLFLGVFGKKFQVETNEKADAVRDVLPGNNCGGCGYAGCKMCIRDSFRVYQSNAKKWWKKKICL